MPTCLYLSAYYNILNTKKKKLKILLFFPNKYFFKSWKNRVRHFAILIVILLYTYNVPTYILIVVYKYIGFVDIVY